MVSRLEKLETLLAGSPNDPFLKHAIALEYQKLGKDEKAKNIFESLLTKTPEYVGSYYQLAKLLERLGKNDEAIEWYLKGMKVATELNDKHSYNELLLAYEELL